MRFKEFKTSLFEAQKGAQADVPKFDAPGYFTVGDSHSNGVGNYGRGKTWKSLGMDGAKSTDPMHLNAIERIPAGSVVVISLGANDLAAKTPIPQIVSQVQKVINAARSRTLQVVYLLPTTTAPNKKKDPTRDELRDALSAAIEVPIIDMGQASPTDTMGVHLDSGKYNKIGSDIVGSYKPKAMGLLQDPKTNLGNPDQEPGAPRVKDRIKNSSELQQGPPYPADQRDEVKKMQTSLQGLGYDLGKYGTDGKFGPFTAAAVAAFKKDYDLKGNSSSFGNEEFAMLDKINAGQVARVKEPTKTNVSQGTDFDIAALTSVENVDKARKIAENFLGRSMNDDEWKHLIQTTTAESSPNQKEMAQIAAVILNRTRVRYGGRSTVVDIVWAPWQFEPVTGNRKNPGPNKNFLTPVAAPRLAQIIDSYIKYLPDSDKSFLNFTSANPAAYSSPEGRKFLDKMIASGGEKIGGTIFGTVA